ncbi:MAG: hypothetical protein ACLGI2_02550 [Acidimicrobiia bacterium]
MGEPVLAAGRFGRSRPATGGRRDWISMSIHRSGRRCRVWLQPPGDRAGFELRPAGGPADAVVAALAP